MELVWDARHLHNTLDIYKFDLAGTGSANCDRDSLIIHLYVT
jgi:hypothetical protein